MSCQPEGGECRGCSESDDGCGSPCSIEICAPPGWHACVGGCSQEQCCDYQGGNPFEQPDPRCCPKPRLLMRTTGNLPKRDFGRRSSQMVRHYLEIKKYDKIMHPESSFLYRRYGQLDI